MGLLIRRRPGCRTEGEKMRSLTYHRSNRVTFTALTIALAMVVVGLFYVVRSAEAHHKPGHHKGGTKPPPTLACNKGEFLAQYRNELMTFATQPVLTRCEPDINNDWASSSPGSGVNADSFTARWVGTFDFEASDYEFTVTSDDGIRLWIDGQLLIDQWKDQAATYRATKTMTAGEHEIEVEYYENVGSAVAKVSWAALPPPPPASGSVTGEFKKWHPLTISFTGPSTTETNSSPNPFLDYRLQVSFTSPSGKSIEVPGFYDGDGNGASSGAVWKVRFNPDESGTWGYKASFRQGANVAIDTSATAGSPTSFDGASGTFNISPRDPAAPGFLSQGLLEYANGHYLKFRDGSYYLKGGADSPENWLGYAGFDNTPNAKHSFAPHVQDWQVGDPTFNTSSAEGGKGLIGALNYLSSQGINSIYFLPMNIGGDGRDSSPYVSVSNWGGEHG